MPSTLIKMCKDELVPPLTTLINQSFNEGIFPERLKISKVIPVLKKGGNSTELNYYRPISLLPAISKVYEKAMSDRLYNFLEKNKILDKNQYGFRKKHSTTLAVYTYVQEILNHNHRSHARYD
jgi:hypothetical protein